MKPIGRRMTEHVCAITHIPGGHPPARRSIQSVRSCSRLAQPCEGLVADGRLLATYNVAQAMAQAAATMSAAQP